MSATRSPCGSMTVVPMSASIAASARLSSSVLLPEPVAPERDDVARQDPSRDRAAADRATPRRRGRALARGRWRRGGGAASGRSRTKPARSKDASGRYQSWASSQSARRARGGLRDRAAADLPADLLVTVAQGMGEVDEPPEERLGLVGRRRRRPRARRPTSKPTTPRRFRAWASRSSGDSSGGLRERRRAVLSWKSRPSMIAVPMTCFIDSELDTDGGETLLPPGVGRNRTDEEPEPDLGAGGRAFERGGEPVEGPPGGRAWLSQRPRRADGEAADRGCGRAAAWTGRVTASSVPGYSARRAFSTWAATCRLVTISHASCPSVWTTQSSADGQPTRQRSKPRRCRGWRARMSSIARSGSGGSPDGGEMTRRTASAATPRRRRAAWRPGRAADRS